MACYHPIEAWDITPDLHDAFTERKISFHAFSDLQRKKMIQQGRRLLLPCRKCVGCRLAKSREWANRVIMEQIYHEDAYFLTLTYDDEHLPAAHALSASGSSLSVHATLVKSDLQKFFKRLRKNSGQKFRYFAAGEYGTSTYRPHYHVLLFGLSLNDLQVLSKNFAGSQYFTSDLIAKSWDFGYHILGQVTWQSAAYTARYTMKKATHGFDKRYYVVAGIEPEFQTMSLKPAIGAQYLFDHPEIMLYDTFSVSTPQGGRKMRPPEYFRKIWKEAHPQEALDRSLQLRAQSEINYHLKLMLTDNDFFDILKIEEEKQLSNLHSLIRDTI
ncbi:replication initiator protein [Dipodfec virus UOA04_Rod_862]|nr:replication initiator protein [Dipodfec virus UOA04_Rod_862]